MANLQAIYRPPNKPSVTLWEQPLSPGLARTIGQISGDGIPDQYRADYGVKSPLVDVKHQRHLDARHVAVRWDGDQLHVRRLAAVNLAKVVHPDTEKPFDDPFTVDVGSGFQIAEFEFRVLNDMPAPGPPSGLTPKLPGGPDGPKSLSFDVRPDKHESRPAKLVDPDRLINLLHQVIADAPLTEDGTAFIDSVLRKLLVAIPAATEAALIDLAADEFESGRARQHAVPGPVFFSRTLARKAVTESRGEIWVNSFGPNRPSNAPASSVRSGTDWQLYVPVLANAGRKLTVYVCGKLPDHLIGTADIEKHPDLAQAREATQLVAGVYSTLTRLWAEQRKTNKLKQFLPKPVQVLADRGPLDDILKPRVVAEITVLFCDLRGFTHLTETEAINPGRLEQLWADTIGAALGLMAEAVIDQDGVIGSFLGDAIMAFWGWPDHAEDQADRAVKAASVIWRKFAREREARPDSPLGKLGFGIGVAHGPALAGRLGTFEQRKVDVIGPTVNLAARLEGLTRPFGPAVNQNDRQPLGPVLLDGPTVAALRGADIRDRIRRLGWVLPKGVGVPVSLYELHTRLDEAPTDRIREQVKRYDHGLRHFEAGRWADARATLFPILDRDSCSQYLTTVVMAGRDAPPNDWPRRTDDNACVMAMSAK